MKKILVSFFAAIVCLGAAAQNTDAVNAYIEQYKQLAIEEMIRTGVPASITLAQGILESGAGKSELTEQSNNHFGIKCKTDWTGEVVYHDDDLKGECFRRYNSAEDSYRDHSDFLRNRPNYASLFNIEVTDYKGWAYGLKAAGYATSPAYATMLINTIEKYDLESITTAGLMQNKQITIAAAPVKMEDEIAFVNTTTLVKPADDKKDASVKLTKYPDGVFTINQTKVIYAKAGTSLLAIANKYNLAYGKLLGFNDMKDGNILSQSCLVYLERKQKRGAKDYHIASPNENLHDVAQEEGVQLQSLLAYNNYPGNTLLKAGDKILLSKK
ncbi:MAG: glucosaminidase domain-containing protein [Bacteroidetes bacterium]|nr:glucosaminidase domain-containing protein [Bacteroidota bacterium]